MTPEARVALERYLLAMADDELVIGYRDTEWTGAAPMLNHALDARSTQTLIRGESLLQIGDIPQALCQDQRILYGQRCALSRTGRNCVDCITNQDHRTFLPEGLRGDIIDRITDDRALRRPDHLGDER